jgi:hypothetical protein
MGQTRRPRRAPGLTLSFTVFYLVTNFYRAWPEDRPAVAAEALTGGNGGGWRLDARASEDLTRSGRGLVITLN